MPGRRQLVLKSKEPSRKGGRRRAEALTPERRSAIATDAAEARWGKRRQLDPITDEETDNPVSGEEDWPTGVLPEARHKGVLLIMDAELPCYVLSDGRRVIGRTSATEMLTGIKGGGAFEKYVGSASLRAFIPAEEIFESMVAFELPEVSGLDRQVRGLPAEGFIEVCRGLVAALEASSRSDSLLRLTSRQMDMAMRAGMFLSACAKVGLDALIDEATGYQYERAQDALAVKLRAYLEAEMRQWEKTFPDELWEEFGRLTGWSHSVTRRPKYWGYLVMELVYDYLDPDVAKWLKDNAPAPRKGQNYHQWLTSQFGLRKLTEHIWKLIGIAKTCQSLPELKDKMAQLHGRQQVHFQITLPYPEAETPKT